MSANPIAPLAWLARRRFQSFSEAAGTVLDLLAPLFPDCKIVLGQFDDHEGDYRIVDARGPGMPGLEAGATVPADRVATDRDGADGHAAAERWAPRLEGPETVVTAPLEASDGRHVGVLCAIADDITFTAVDEDVLAVTARLLAYEWERVMWAASMLKLSDQLRDPRRSDAVTGLLNRESFEEALERERLLARESVMESYLVVVSVTGLHAVRSRYGEPMADLLLKKAAETVSAAIRGGDHAGRLGGDVLAAVLVDCGGAEGAAAFCDRLATTLERAMGDRSAAVVGTSLVPLRLGDYGSSREALLAATPTARAQAVARWGGNAA
jgi:diguanylate cyclase (GGDEF)-like protein